MYRWKGLEKCYSVKIFWKILTETVTIKNLKHDIYQEENFNNYDILSIVEKVIKNVIQWYYFRQRRLKLSQRKTPNLVYVNEKIFNY